MSIRKAGVEFTPTLVLAPGMTGLASTISGKYKLEGATTFTPFPEGFTEGDAGVYTSKLTLATAGTYMVEIVSTNENVATSVGYITVTAATLDDLAALINSAQSDITSIKSSVEVLDDTIIQNISDTAVEIDTRLTELKALMTDTEDPAIVSLTELLQQIQAAGSSRDSVIAALTSYTDDLEAMIRGDEFMSDGTTPNPFFGKSTHDVYDQVEAAVALLQNAITTAKDATVADAHTTRDLLAGKIDAIKAVADANTATLGNATYGLEALKNGITTIINNTDGGTQSIIDILNDASTGLAAIKTAVMDKLAGIETKIDNIATKQANTVQASIAM